MAVIDDHSRHRMNALGQVKLLTFPHFIGVAIRGQNLAGTRHIQTHLARNTRQYFMRSGTVPIGKVGLEQCFLQLPLLVRIHLSGPVQQAVRIKGVVNAAASATGLVGLAEFETHLFTTHANILPVGMRLRWRDAVLFGDVLGNFLTFRHHMRIELKRLEMQFGADVARHAPKRLVQRFEADDAPRAGNVRDEIDFERSGHGGMGLNSTRVGC